MLGKLVSSNSRTGKLNRNIIFSILLQAISMGISLLLLPISLKFVTVEQYGIWLTINSILMWTAHLDLGLGSGLKNRLGEAIANGNYSLARNYISTAYAVMIIIMIVVASIFLILSSNFSYYKLFNLSADYEQIVQKTINIVFYLFLTRFLLQLVNYILDAMQLIFVSKIINAFSQVLLLGVILFLSISMQGDIYILGLAFTLTPVIVLFISTIIIFVKKPGLCPSVSSVNFSFAKSIYSLGFKFFFIQLSRLVLFQTSSILIINLFGPEEVVQYNIAFSLFSIANVAFSTVSAPYWAAYINAWNQNDIEWIKKTNQKLLMIWIGIISITFIVLLLSEQIYEIWIGNKVSIPFILSATIFLYILTFSFSGVYNMFINGTGKIQLQIVALGISSLIFLPLVFFLVKILNIGLVSIPISLMLISSYSFILAPIQYRKLLNGTATGIWNK